MFFLPLFFFTFRAHLLFFCFFFFNDTATTEIYTLSLHDALPIYVLGLGKAVDFTLVSHAAWFGLPHFSTPARSEEHTSELQSRSDLVCRLLLEKKKTNRANYERQRVSTVSEHKPNSDTVAMDSAT